MRNPLPKTWPKKFKTFWCVVDGRGTAYLVTAREKRSNSIAAWLADADKAGHGWRWWREARYACQRVDIKVRSAVPNGMRGGEA